MLHNRCRVNSALILFFHNHILGGEDAFKKCNLLCFFVRWWIRSSAYMENAKNSTVISASKSICRGGSVEACLPHEMLEWFLSSILLCSHPGEECLNAFS